MFSEKFLQLVNQKAKIILMVFILVFSFIFLNNFLTVYAADPKLSEDVERLLDGADTARSAAGLSEAEVTSKIGIIVGAVLSLLGVVFFILMIYGGATWMLAQGNDQEVNKARDIIKAAIIGLILVLASYAIASYLGAELI